MSEPFLRQDKLKLRPPNCMEAIGPDVADGKTLLAGLKLGAYNIQRGFAYFAQPQPT